MASSNLYVYVLTHCPHLKNLYGTTLVFKTLRTGFPTAPLHVVDNCSILQARPILEAAAKECDAFYTQLDDNKLDHHEFISETLSAQAGGAAVFVDADIIFWENVENWTFGNALLAGRRIPAHLCPLSGCLIHERLHSSFMWIPSIAALLEKVQALRRKHFAFAPLQEFMFSLNGQWQTIDTFGGIYNALNQSEIHDFTSSELDCYDHLLYGTYFDSVVSALKPPYAKKFASAHQQAQTDYKQVRGLWRMQEDYFNSLAP